MKYVCYPRPSLEVALSTSKFSIFVNFFKEYVNKQEISINVESYASKNICLEKISSAVW
jgi:hypothetical protein